MALADTHAELMNREEKGMLKPPYSLRRFAMAICKAERDILLSALNTISLTTQWQQQGCCL